jgi:hypothetical protein
LTRCGDAGPTIRNRKCPWTDARGHVVPFHDEVLSIRHGRGALVPIAPMGADPRPQIGNASASDGRRRSSAEKSAASQTNPLPAVRPVRTRAALATRRRRGDRHLRCSTNCMLVLRARADPATCRGVTYTACIHRTQNLTACDSSCARGRRWHGSTDSASHAMLALG